MDSFTTFPEVACFLLLVLKDDLKTFNPKLFPWPAGDQSRGVGKPPLSSDLLHDPVSREGRVSGPYKIKVYRSPGGGLGHP